MCFAKEKESVNELTSTLFLQQAALPAAILLQGRESRVVADLEKIFFVQAGYKDSYLLPNSSWPSKAIDSVETRLGNDKGQHVAIGVLGMNPWGGKKKCLTKKDQSKKECLLGM